MKAYSGIYPGKPEEWQEDTYGIPEDLRMQYLEQQHKAIAARRHAEHAHRDYLEEARRLDEIMAQMRMEQEKQE